MRHDVMGECAFCACLHAALACEIERERVSLAGACERVCAIVERERSSSRRDRVYFSVRVVCDMFLRECVTESGTDL